VDRIHRELTDEEVARMADTYHARRGAKDAGPYAGVPGYCKSATLEEGRFGPHRQSLRHSSIRPTWRARSSVAEKAAPSPPCAMRCCPS
jgi:hypothetical protein